MLSDDKDLEETTHRPIARRESSGKPLDNYLLEPTRREEEQLQELQEDGCLESVCLNAACLALLDASVPLKFLLASVTVVVTEEGRIICDPTSKQLRASVATATFVFSNRQSGEKSPSIVSSYSDGMMSPSKLQECLSTAHTASQQIFAFYKEALRRKFSKEI